MIEISSSYLVPELEDIIAGKIVITPIDVSDEVQSMLLSFPFGGGYHHNVPPDPMQHSITL